MPTRLAGKPAHDAGTFLARSRTTVSRPPSAAFTGLLRSHRHGLRPSATGSHLALVPQEARSRDRYRGHRQAVDLGCSPVLRAGSGARLMPDLYRGRPQRDGLNRTRLAAVVRSDKYCGVRKRYALLLTESLEVLDLDVLDQHDSSSRDAWASRCGYLAPNSDHGDARPRSAKASCPRSLSTHQLSGCRDSSPCQWAQAGRNLPAPASYARRMRGCAPRSRRPP